MFLRTCNAALPRKPKASVLLRLGTHHGILLLYVPLRFKSDFSSPPPPSILVSTRKQLQAAGKKKTKIAAILHVKRNACGRISLEFYKFDEVSWGTKLLINYPWDFLLEHRCSLENCQLKLPCILQQLSLTHLSEAKSSCPD